MALDFVSGKPQVRLAAAFLAIGIATMLLFGCVGPSQQVSSSFSQLEGAPSQVSSAQSAPTGTDKVDAAADPKTGFDKTKQAIDLAVADGTYANPVNYQSPGGENTFTASVTVKDDIVTAASVTAIAADEKSSKYIANYNKNIQPLVIGKKITGLNLPKNVAGSSLTNAAFQQYVADVIAKY